MNSFKGYLVGRQDASFNLAVKAVAWVHVCKG